MSTTATLVRQAKLQAAEARRHAARARQEARRAVGWALALPGAPGGLLAHVANATL